MQFFLQRLPFFIELVFNGFYIFLYALTKYQKFSVFGNVHIRDNLISVGAYYVPLVLLLQVIVNYATEKHLDNFFRKHSFSLIVFVPALMTMGDQQFAFWMACVHLLSSIFSHFDMDSHLVHDGMKKRMQTLSALKLSPAQIVMLTFAGTIMVGAFLLVIPVSTKTGEPLAFIDALFMSTSAVCVTGLTTVSVVNTFSVFGQMVLLMLMQIGGLGIMTLSAAMTILMGKNMAMKERVLMQDLLEASNLEQLMDVITGIVKYTFVIELWGAILLTVALVFDGKELSAAIYYGFFHSVSAFCNSGLALWDNSFENFATNPLINFTLCALIILGGLGFMVLKELRLWIAKERKFVQFSLHSKVVIQTTLALIVAGTVIIFFGEYLHGIDGFSLFGKFQVAVFQSITARTAGFNTIALPGLHSFTLFSMLILMFIGASPGSTGGGVKTTTFAILIQSLRATLRGRDRVEMYGRTVLPSIVVKAIALFILSLGVVSFFIYLMLSVEVKQTFLPILFECVSAFGTVGLSLGITPYLSVTGKLLISLLMYIGRIGPLTLILAIGESKGVSGKVDYPEGRVMIG